MGRVSVDQIEDATLFIVPAKKDFSIAFFAAWLAGWSFAGRLVIPAWRSLAHPASADWFQALWGIGWLFGIWFAGSAILWGLGGVEQLRLSYTNAELVKRLFGVVFSRKVVPTMEIRNLRFTPASGGGKRHRQSRISFESQQKTISFGSGLEDGEALAVIERMLEIYPLPKKDRALEYLDLSS